MSTVEVSSWPELKAALQNNDNDGNTIKLIADIDMNGVAPTGDNIVMTYTNSMILDGDNHTIKNLRTKVSSPVTIFGMNLGSTGGAFTIKNLNFQNLISAGASLIGANGGYTAGTTVLEDVNICGTRSGAAYLFSYTGGITMTSCSIDLPWKGTGSTLTYTSLKPKTSGTSPSITDYANYCRFVESYGGWDVPDTIYYTDEDSAFLGCSYFKLSGCRIEGSVKLPYGNNKYYPYIHNPYVCKYTPSAQNVCDLDWKGTVTYGNINTAYYQNFSGVMKKAFFKADGTAVSNPTNGGASGYPKPILATESQMKDASYLSGQGFDIIVPSE